MSFLDTRFHTPCSSKKVQSNCKLFIQDNNNNSCHFFLNWQDLFKRIVVSLSMISFDRSIKQKKNLYRFRRKYIAV